MTLSAANIDHVVLSVNFGQQVATLLDEPAKRGAGYSGNRALIAAFPEYKKPVTVALRIHATNPANTVHSRPRFKASIRSHGTVPVNCNVTNRALPELCIAAFVKGLAA